MIQDVLEQLMCNNVEYIVLGDNINESYEHMTQSRSALDKT